MKRKASAIAVVGAVLRLVVGRLAEEAAAVPCHVTGTSPAGSAVSHAMGSGAVQQASEHMADAAWTDLAFDRH